MEKRALGKTGIRVSEVAFGGVEIGMPYGIGVHGREDMLPEQDAIRLLHAAVDGGINFFDTARLYGNSEEIMGRAFHDRRKDVVLATKCRHLHAPGQPLPPSETLREIIWGSLQESLRALQTDYVDVFMLHQASAAILDSQEVAAVFRDIKRQGICRATGISTYHTTETEQAVASGDWDVIQLPYNLMDQRQALCFDAAEAAGVGLVVRSVLLKGILGDRGRRLHPALKDVEVHVGKYAALQDELPLAEFAVKFALSSRQVAAVLIGIDKPEYLEATLRTADGRYLDAAAFAAAKRLSYPNPAFLDLPAWDRNGWLK
ncbi:aldo/keto reductase [Chitinophaga pollutisoli]|uniref:Aldo/keto reductase n=1 Tax=Chitinophaga pollutisoli TaxID=3133966 RepID=A0ABZ2YQL3_9BACT